jgi:hypothetical protein
VIGALRRDAPWAAAALVLALLPGGLRAAPEAAAANGETADESYEFLSRHGQLLFEYGKYDEALSAFAAACATPEGAADFDCWRKLAASAERARRIGDAIEAWERAAALGGEGSATADQESGRLRAAFGRVRLLPAPGRSLPSWPLRLEYQGLLIDPALKAYLAGLTGGLAAAGVAEEELWLPAGDYTAGRLHFVVTAGETLELPLPARFLPYRQLAWGLAGDGQGRPLGGPWELGVDGELLAGGIPGGRAEQGLPQWGFRLRLARHLGPLRLEASGLLSWRPAWAGPGAAAPLLGARLGSLGVGFDLALGRAAWLVPHAAFVGGSAGTVETGCVARQVGSGAAWQGRCRVSTLALGARAGLDLFGIPGAARRRAGRIALRIGIFGEALGGGIAAVPGDGLESGFDLKLVQAARWRMAWLHGGLDGAVSLRF